MKCEICESPRTFRALDLGEQPLANDFAGRFGKFPLSVLACRSCGHGSIETKINPAIIFRDYPYVTGTSRTLREYCEAFADMVTRENDADGCCLEIGCNDGTQMRALAARRWTVAGIDPAENLAQFQTGLAVDRNFFGADWAHDRQRRYNVVIAQNVLAHTPDPADFMLGLWFATKPGGRVYVQVSQADWIEKAQFDCVYHEHFSYFSRHSLCKLAADHGFRIEQIRREEVHGGSLIAVLRRPPEGSPIARHRSPYFDADGWETLADRVLDVVELAREHVPPDAIGLGAPAKGTVFLNYASKIQLSCILDENPAKFRKRMPGTPFFIHSLESCKYFPTGRTFFVLAWNFYNELVAKVKALRPGMADKFVAVFPNLTIHNS